MTLELEDIVPPLELCKQIPEGKFENSVFAWAIKDGTFDFIEQRDILQVSIRSRIIAPAPTLQEIFDELSETGNCFSRRGELGWMTMFEIPGDEEGYGYEVKTEHDKTNPATAALRLWLSVQSDKSVENPK